MGLLAAGAGLLGKGITSALGINEAAKARKFARKNYRHRFQWSVEDMRKAGINPLFAAGMGLGGGGSPGGTAGNIPDFGGVGDQLNTAKRVSNETKLMRLNRMQIVAGTAKTTAETANIEKQNIILDTQIPRAKAAQMVDEQLVGPGVNILGEMMNQNSGKLIDNQEIRALIDAMGYGPPKGWKSKSPTHNKSKGRRKNLR